MSADEKLIEAMGAVRKAMALVESVFAGDSAPESLLGVYPKLRACLDDINMAVKEVRQ